MSDKSIINFKDPIVFRNLFKIVMREWAHHLTTTQLSVVLFVLDRTAAWGKEVELIKYESFVEGISSFDGSKIYAAGVCNSITTAKRITNELVTIGMLCKKYTRNGNLWWLNYGWKHEDMLKLPKNKAVRVPTSGHPRCPPVDHPINRKKNYVLLSGKEPSKERIPEPNSSGILRESLEKKINETKFKSKQARERRLAKKDGKLSSADINTIWVAALRSAPWFETVATSAYLSSKDAKVLQAYSTRFHKARPKHSFETYITWVIHRWPGLVVDLFYWMGNPPAPITPQALFIVKWYDQIEDKWMKREAFERHLNMSAEEIRMEERVKMGLASEEARDNIRIITRRPKPEPPKTAVPVRTYKPVKLDIPRFTGNEEGYFGKYEE